MSVLLQLVVTGRFASRGDRSVRQCAGRIASHNLITTACSPNDVMIQVISRVSGPRIHRHGTSPCAVYRLPY